jgi:crossover junction endodeoxyribonuclease RuvC
VRAISPNATALQLLARVTPTASSVTLHSRMRILGIDPGLQLTGYGVIDYDPLRPRLLDAGVIRLDSKSSIPDRLVELERELESLLTEYKPNHVAVEQLYSHYAHPRTAILMAHARGVILLIARKHHTDVHEFAANRIKQSLTGHGHAAKAQMQRAIQSQWNLAAPPEPPDVADALAVALCCGRALENQADAASKTSPRRGRQIPNTSLRLPA